MSDIESEYRILFSRASKEETLLVMVKAQVRKMNLMYDETLYSYRVAAENYRRFKRAKAVALFTAAHERLNRLKEKGKC